MVNEKRLIDAAPLAKNGWHLVKTGESNRLLASMSLADVPTVDAVEVVRCKDCKYWIKAGNGSWQMAGRTDGACQHLIGTHLAERYMTECEHFCSYGERRNEE